MSTNHQMNYYDYGKTLNAEGVMTALIGGGVNPDPHEYVDLGLPSGTLWATENIKDADGNEFYFAWGETSGYTSGQVGTERSFSEESYKFNPEGHTEYTPSKYNSTDKLTVLEPEDDAATVNWGKGWRMPTKEEFEELISSANTEAIFTQQNGVSGLLVTSKVEGYDGNSVFFPAVGYADNGDVYSVGGYGNYWSSSLSSDEVTNAWELYFDGGSRYITDGSRYIGYSVRPVRF